MNTTNRYSSEFTQRAVRLVGAGRQDNQSEWVAIKSVSEKLGCTRETLRRWVRQDQRNRALSAKLTKEERTRLKTLERENKELRRANEILKTASAFVLKPSSTAD